MEYFREKYLERTNVKWLAQFLTLSFVAMFLPFFIHQQIITGPIVNAILILALFFTGLKSALLIACLPSFMALAGGLLPSALAPAIPFIIIGNMIYVLAINFIPKKFYFSGALIASGLKFVFLLVSVNIVAAWFIKGNLIGAVGRMMGVEQFITAFLGACLAYPILKFFKNKSL
jgi:hypothetical protein